MEMKLFIQAKEILGKESIKDIEEIIKKSFPDFKIDINIKYKIDTNSQKDMEIYIDRIRNYILDKIPSSSSWIEGINLN